ncbi:serine/threonine-protein kinase [Polyangium mundeleinium]|uniref:Serine/threonine-protein kinase n=1 Tax=Polyangium mundeleinium TaxID=2995306 RepID=A0ABT5F2N0_9BACT|nr:serine/threonine-protein kinase [Polyangium mundeleinium]MDC0747417.1 serine/threonine-protein kinase [Polyangium mundeleinium]
MKAGDLVGGKYRLARRLGQGAMGVVWEAVHEMTSRRVAVKLIVNATDNLRRRLLREARAAGQIAHRNVVEVYDVGETADEDPFLVMQLLSGDTLYGCVKRDGRMDVARALPIARDVGRALTAAHAQGIIHRDLKPANVFLHHEAGAPDELVKVLDFGLCKPMGAEEMLTVPGGLLGSPAYMSPEQIAGAPDLDPRTDIWSYGVLMFELFAGQRPFAGRGPDLIHAVLTAPIPRLRELVPSIDLAIDEIVAGCIVRDKRARIGSAAEIVARLEPLVEKMRSSGAQASSDDGDEGALAVTMVYRPGVTGPPSTSSPPASHKVAKTIPLAAFTGNPMPGAPPPMKETAGPPPSYPQGVPPSQPEPPKSAPRSAMPSGWPGGPPVGAPPQAAPLGMPNLQGTMPLQGLPEAQRAAWGAPHPQAPPQPNWQAMTGQNQAAVPYTPAQPAAPERRWIGFVILAVGVLALVGVLAGIGLFARRSPAPPAPSAPSAAPASR